jgi:protein transport protein SEC61 subunit gamma-like protein
MRDIEGKIREYIKLLRMTRKPDSEEFFTTTKVALAVMAIIGFVGFVIYLLMNVLPGELK